MRTAISVFLLSLAPLVAQQPVADWKPFSAPNGAFTALFPSVPSEQKKQIKTSLGLTDLFVFEVVVPPGDGKYSISWSEFPKDAIKPGSQDKRLDNVRDLAITASKGKLKREKSLFLDIHPGRELIIEAEGKASVVMRIFAVDNRFYEIVAVGGAEFVSSKETKTFLESFKLGK